MKKRALLFSILILPLILLLPLVLAQNETEVDRAYSCLENKLGSNCADSNSIEQLSLSLLAIGYDKDLQADCKSALINKKEIDSSWGDEDIKLTAQAILALNHIGENIQDSVNWLLSQEESTNDLNWFLQIDANNATECEISVNNGSSRDFDIRENKKVSGSSSCLDPASSEQNYYYEIDEDCLGDEFTISCDEQFITSVFYKKPRDSVYYISSQTHSAPPDGETKETANSYCFTTSNDCEYEATLWATLALAELGEDVSKYLPYLSMGSKEIDNKKYLPSAFLYKFTDDDEYYSDLIDKQNQNNYWEETSNNKFYDTAVVLLALGGTNINAVDNAVDYLFDVQEDSGCWHSDNLLETSFLLFANWPKDPYLGTGITRSDCKASGFSCVSSGLCTSLDTQSGYYCSGLGDVCCSSEKELESCSEKQGIICESDQRCTASEVLASNTNFCCLGDCELQTTENECELAGYTCRSSCSESQEETIAYSGDCDFGEICCKSKPKKESKLGLIILLIILIILVVLAIIFRDQLKIWFFRIKSKFKFGKGPKPSTRPPMPPPGGVPQLTRPRQIISRQPTRRMPARRMPQRGVQRDTAFEDTMKKLRDMTQ